MFQYDAPPAGETAFNLGSQRYRRSYDRCGLCGHWFSVNPMDMSDLYSGAYVSNTYGEHMRATFERIIALPATRSDNSGRVACILKFAKTHFRPGTVPRLLDVGAGLGIFPYSMKRAGWDCTALDPDARAAQHAGEVVGVKALTGDFMTTEANTLGRFDVITFNKVLEHVEDPVAMLVKAYQALATGGFVYVEVPDGDAAAAEGQGREEFFVEHHHVFSPASVTLLAGRVGFSVVLVERLREPSGKFTLRAFLAMKQT